MRTGALIYFFVIAIAAQAQNKIEWSENSKLQLTDFKSPSTEIGSGATAFIQSGAAIDFGFQMTNAEFMMTKNWNSKITASFFQNAASLVAPDDSTAAQLIAYAQFDFDLTELCARKFRKRVFEEKKAFSSITMFQPLFDEAEREHHTRNAKVAKETDLGAKRDLLKTYHEEVIAEIKEYADFCKSCKPPKKKK